MPAKLHCKFTNCDLCTLCFALLHVKKLPQEAGEIPPERIDYQGQLKDTLALITYGGKDDDQSSMPGSRMPSRAGSRPATRESVNSLGSLDANEIKRVLGTDWHQFYDRTGISFYYNFLTEESYRTPPQATQDEMAKAKEIEQMFNKPEKTLRTPREIRPPYRDHNHAQMGAPTV